MRLTDQTSAPGTITTRNNMDFNNFFDGDYTTNEEEDKLIDGFSYDSALKLAETLSKSDQLRLSLYLLENSIEDLSNDQWQNLIFYLKRRKGVKSDDRIEQKRLENNFSREIVSTSYNDYTPRELIADYLNVYFDWEAEELDTLQSTTVFFTEIWHDFVKHVARKTGWNEQKVKRTIKREYFKRYLSNYGAYSRKMMYKDEELHQDWLTKATILAKREDVSKKSAKELLYKQDPEDYKRSNCKTWRTVIEGLPTLRKEWQVSPPNFIHKK